MTKYGEMSSGTEEKAGLLSRLGLNDNKAGMQNLDREKINQIIYEASKGEYTDLALPHFKLYLPR